MLFIPYLQTLFITWDHGIEVQAEDNNTFLLVDVIELGTGGELFFSGTKGIAEVAVYMKKASTKSASPSI